MSAARPLLLVLFSICVSLLGLGQDTTLFRFKVEGNTVDDTTVYYGESLEFTTARIRCSGNYFLECNLFSGQTIDWKNGDIDTFKIRQGIWYIKRNGKWNYFFSKEGFKLKRKASVKIAGHDYFFIPQRIVVNNDHVLYELMAQPVEANIHSSDILRYTFDPSVGIVKIFSSDVVLVRQKFRDISQ